MNTPKARGDEHAEEHADAHNVLRAGPAPLALHRVE